MASPGVVNLQVYQGDRYELFFRVRLRTLDTDGVTWIPGAYVDLTGWNPTSEIRKEKADASPIGSFECSLGDQTTLPGSVLCVLKPSVSVLLTESNYYYDVQLELDADNITTYLQGQILVTLEVTRG